MAEENQNAEMEDILSSIKNILEENETAQSQDMGRQIFEQTENSPEISAETDDILELSPDMRSEPEPVTIAEIPLSETESVDVSQPVETPFENIAEANGFEQDEDVLSFENDISLEEFEKGTDEISPYNQEAKPVFVQETANQAEDADALDVVDDLINAPQDEVEQLISEPAAVSDLEEIVPAEQADNIELPVVSESVEEPEQLPEISSFLEPETAAAEQKDVIAEVVEEPSGEVLTDIAVPEVAAVVETEIETLPQEEAKEEPAKDDVVDVSAGIISNFAKMFAKEEHHKETSKEEPVKITAAGDVGKTLEEFVLESVSKVIGSEIKRQWNDGAAFNALAEAEIKRQTQNWINDNLPSLVEKIVKQEIERVIAKVGS